VEQQLLAGLSELVVDGLGDGDARELLGSVIRWPLDERVRDRIVAETGGNPLALLELPRGLSPAALAGGFGLPGVQPLPARIEHSFQRRLAPLSADTRRLLLVAAAESAGESTLVWRAAGRLGIGVEAAEAAELEGLVDFGARVRFRHPLVRSAIYRSASAQDRRDVHRVLAEVTDPQLDPDRRAWHLAQATSEPDEEVAGELERSAGRAQSRGGFAAAAAFLERATELTPDPAHRGARGLAAAQAELDAGAPDRAYALLATAEMAPLDELQRARSDVVRAQIASARQGGGDASALMLATAKRLEPLDAELSREAYLEALGAAMFAGRFGGVVGVREVADAARAAALAGSSLSSPRALDLLLDGLVTRFIEGYPAGVAPLRRALLVEAGVRSGTREVAAEALEQLVERTGASATEWALGIEARSRALLSQSKTAGPLYGEAITRLARSRITVHLGRAHLIYGEWLRRERQKTEAREQLRTALKMFAAIGAETFAHPRQTRAAGHRRDRPQTRRADNQSAHRPRSPNRPAGPGRPLKSGNRRAVIHKSAHRPISPAQGVHQARYHLARPTQASDP
jgi:hypothetical protein